MYGLVNKAIEQMVIQQHDDATWQAIRRQAGLEDEFFLTHEPYPDEVTYQLVDAASQVLAVPMDQLLHAFGQYWILHTAKEGYGHLIKAHGSSVAEFLQGLPNFHSRISLVFPKLQPPVFSCSDVTATSLSLHYMTHRPGLSSFVVGLVHGLGAMYQTPCTVKQTAFKAQGDDHDVFEVRWGTEAPR